MRPSLSLLAAVLVGSLTTDGFAQPGTSSPSAPAAAPARPAAEPTDPAEPPQPAQPTPPSGAAPAPAPQPAEPPGASGAAGDAAQPQPAPGASKPAEPGTVAAEAAELDEHGEPLPPLVPAAEDTVGGHFNVGLAAAVAVPFGSFEADVPASDVVGPGFAFNADLALGISRSVFLGVWGQLALLGEGDGCGDLDHSETCDGKSYAGGVFVRYHLVQGVRFDPWLMAGAGYRMTSLEPIDIDYSGFEVVKLGVGGDWYAFSNVGLGALLELNVGVYTDRSRGSLGDAAAYWQFASGLRLVFDVPGK